MERRVLVGTSGWVYPHWRGVFYPPDLPQGRWLEHYCAWFPTVELNNSFYHLPQESAWRRWREATPPGFLFAVKASRFITHIKRLKGGQEPLGRFLGRARLLGEKLGPVLYQLPPSFRCDLERLGGFLSLLPPDLEAVFEFRHGSWFRDEVYDLLRRQGAGLCVYDMPGFTTPLVVTAPFAYIRFHGSEALYGGSYPDAELERWAEWILGLPEGVERVYVYFNNDAFGYAVQNALTLTRLLGAGQRKGSSSSSGGGGTEA